MRDLASICTIEKVWPLEGKDRVQGASFVENGYEVMVSKDIQPGMLVAFIQEGAILPEINAWEWLRKRCYRDSLKGFLIKAQKFGTIKSWGLAVPLNELPIADERVINKLKSGDDLTDLLEIRKYEPEEDASPTKGESKKAYPKWVKFCLGHLLTRWIGRLWQKRHQNSGGEFPSDLISKSDETTIQNMKGALQKYADEKVVITAKMEGQSFCVVPTFKGKKLTGAYVCSRNNAYKVPDNSIFWNMMRKYDIVNKMKELWKTKHRAFILQGEQVGPGIQNNIYNFKENQWFLFTVKDFETLNQLSYTEMEKVAKIFGCKAVPAVDCGILKDIMPNIDAAVAYAEKVCWIPVNGIEIETYYNPATGKLWKDYFQHEGVVVRSFNYDKDKGIGVSFKVKGFSYAETGLPKIASLCREFLQK